MGHGSSGSSGRGAGKAASVARDGADDDLAFSVWRRFGEKNVGFVSRRRLAPPRSHRSASSSSLSTNDTCHTIGLDLGTLSTLVITKRMCAQISGASTDDDDGAPPASLRASARSLEVFAAAGPARRPPPHEHVCAAPSERTNGARPPRSTSRFAPRALRPAARARAFGRSEDGCSTSPSRPREFSSEPRNASLRNEWGGFKTDAYGVVV